MLYANAFNAFYAFIIGQRIRKAAVVRVHVRAWYGMQLEMVATLLQPDYHSLALLRQCIRPHGIYARNLLKWGGNERVKIKMTK